MRILRILAVGRLKTSFWREAADDYLKRLKHGLKVSVDIVKDAPADFSIEERKAQESSALLARLKPGETLICLDETGRSMSSSMFAGFIEKLCDNNEKPCFVIGGAYGLSDEIRQKARHIISFSPMTFTHEMARVILFEQLYRAGRILAGSGYHH